MFSSQGPPQRKCEGYLCSENCGKHRIPEKLAVQKVLHLVWNGHRRDPCYQPLCSELYREKWEVLEEVLRVTQRGEEFWKYCDQHEMRDKIFRLNDEFRNMLSGFVADQRERKKQKQELQRVLEHNADWETLFKKLEKLEQLEKLDDVVEVLKPLDGKLSLATEFLAVQKELAVREREDKFPYPNKVVVLRALSDLDKQEYNVWKVQRQETVWKGYEKWNASNYDKKLFTKDLRLFFCCDFDNGLVPCGHDGRGYKLTVKRDRTARALLCLKALVAVVTTSVNCLLGAKLDTKKLGESIVSELAKAGLKSAEATAKTWVNEQLARDAQKRSQASPAVQLAVQSIEEDQSVVRVRDVMSQRFTDSSMKDCHWVWMDNVDSWKSQYPDGNRTNEK
ncbi:unnamed protein product [Chrysoparadoxa australica]